MSLASPVGKDGFYHNGTDLYVEIGSGNRHARASVAQLNDILRPNSKQSKAAAAQQVQDKVGHWYEAQLIHYGLAASKNKSVCKVRLLDALNKNALNVPDSIKKLEVSLKKDFNAKERKAKAEYKASLAGSANKPVASISKKRKHDDTTSATVQNFSNFSNCNVILGHNGSFSQPSSHQDGAQTVAKRVKKPAIGPTKSSQIKGAPKPKPVGNLAVPSPISKNKNSVTGTGTVTKNVLKTQTSSKAKEPKIKLETKAMSEHTPKKESKVKTERTVKTEIPSSPLQPSIGQNPSPGTSYTSVGLLNGIYDLQSSVLPSNASMTLAVDGNQLWGAFDFGQSMGVIFFPRRPYRASNEPLACQLRSYPHDGTNIGSGRIAFTGDGSIHGSFHGGFVQFQGCRRQGPAYTPRPPASYQEEWEYILTLNSDSDGEEDRPQYDDDDSMEGIRYYD